MNMKLTLLSILPFTALGFQHVVPQVHYKHVDWTEQCTTSRDFCDHAELKMLAEELEQFQGVVPSQDEAKNMYEILRTQRELKRTMEDYIMNDTPSTNDAFDDYIHYHW
eukprot:CAMPEP_0183705006 /NCGR_PEP_ID=MMETSP0737-20130205/2198_1 /TAXON_ID=385413 /ORGANISM="Thalassiosira miniscula, Strain CCMP1093" /LENGTH=108 /DNA_ID=CAMNT_0025932053 /DNA_START=214 /DNA_END=540 /DNA_ORIENTATION=+